MATEIRSPLRYLQPKPFVPGRTLPRDPHRSLKLPDAMNLAAQWGCKIELSGKNDFLVSHPLVDSGRPTVCVSSHRRDTPRHLLAYLRRVKEGVLLHKAKNPDPEPVLAGGLDIPGIKVVESNGDVRHIEPGPEPEFKLDQPAPGAMGDPDGPEAGDEIAGSAYDLLEAMLSHQHYCHHIIYGHVVAFKDCEVKECVHGRAQLAGIIELIARVDILANERDEALEAATRPAPEPVISKPPEAEKKAFPINPICTLTESDSEEKRKLLLMTLLDTVYRAMCNGDWVGTRSRNQTVDAMVMLMERDHWHPKFELALRTGELSSWSRHLATLKRPGGQRLMVGRTLIMNFHEIPAMLTAYRNRMASSPS